MDDITSVEALFVEFSGTSPAMVPGKASQAKFAMWGLCWIVLEVMVLSYKI